jgi:hypothetical protein
VKIERGQINVQGPEAQLDPHTLKALSSTAHPFPSDPASLRKQVQEALSTLHTMEEDASEDFGHPDSDEELGTVPGADNHNSTALQSKTGRAWLRNPICMNILDAFSSFPPEAKNDDRTFGRQLSQSQPATPTSLELSPFLLLPLHPLAPSRQSSFLPNLSLIHPGTPEGATPQPVNPSRFRTTTPVSTFTVPPPTRTPAASPPATGPLSHLRPPRTSALDVTSSASFFGPPPSSGPADVSVAGRAPAALDSAPGPYSSPFKANIPRAEESGYGNHASGPSLLLHTSQIGMGTRMGVRPQQPNLRREFHSALPPVHAPPHHGVYSRLCPRFMEALGASLSFLDSDMTVAGRPRFQELVTRLQLEKLERSTWLLLLAVGPIHHGPPAEASCRPHASEAELVAHLREHDPEFRLYFAVVQWLEQIGAMEHKDFIDDAMYEAQDVCWHATHTLLQRGQTRLRNGEALVTELDPDAVQRQGHHIHPDDEEEEKIFMKKLFTLLRTGKIRKVWSGVGGALRSERKGE